MLDKIRNTAVTLAAALTVAVLAVWGLLEADKPLSLYERRPLNKLPEVSSEAVFSGEFMTSFEKYALDQFPARDSFRTIKAVTAYRVMRLLDNNGIYIIDGSAAKAEYPMNSDSVIYAAERFENVFERYFSGGEYSVYLSVIPDKAFFTASENGYPSMDYDELISLVRENTAFAKYIDITGLLSSEDYYRTDTHWKQENIGKIAVALADGMGIKMNADYTVKDTGKVLYGVYSGQSAMPLKADEIYTVTFPGLEGCRVYDYETEKYIPVYDYSRLTGADAYEMYLSGSKSVLEIENPGIKKARELVVFRDSFASSLAPLLAEGYSRITLIDIRYISSARIESFIPSAPCDVLFLYSTGVLNNSITIKS